MEILGLCRLLSCFADGDLGHDNRHDSGVCGLGSLRLAHIAVPSFTISVRRLHDDGKPVFWAVLPQVAIFYLLAEFTLGLPPNWIVWGILGAITAVAFGFMSLPGIPLDDAYGEEPKED